MNFLEETIKELIKSNAQDFEKLAQIKRKVAKKHKISCPSNANLLKAYHGLLNKKRVKKSQKIEHLLQTKPIRSIAGIVNVSVLTKPYPCPGKCLYCPQEKNIPKSYLSGEPAVERAKKLNYNPYLQVSKRIEMLEYGGHPTDKVEIRIVGATWSYYPLKYRENFIKQCFRACNSKTKKTDLTLSQEQKKNEKAKHRVVGLSIETRPDFINQKEIERLRMFGVTMVELGVQSINNDVLKINLRGHEIQETISATKMLKDAGFKVLYQIMPNLPGSNPNKDKKMFIELFSNPDFQPDLLKIYPCALLKNAPLYNLWKDKKYKPYTEKELINLVREIKKTIPCYVRIQRISRDIPSKTIVSGPAKISNLRQILSEDAKKNKKVFCINDRPCRCIRCREVKEKYIKKEKVLLWREDYRASEGKEIFLSFENKQRTKLYSLLRLRLTSENKAIIREIHTYGKLVPINKKQEAPQHKGLGKKLVLEAEKITKKEFNLKEISVISSVGTRDYFRKLGYKLKNTYMVKSLK